MKDAERIDVGQAVSELSGFDFVLDARSPAEYALDHIPGAISAPVLDDAERARVGTMHKRDGAFAAKRTGAALVSRRIADVLDGPLAACDRGARLLVYCWRGGNRSGALATVLARVGWRTAVLDGGYRAFRRHVLDELDRLPGTLRFVVLAGRTGSGKSLLLERVRALGPQVLDLEALACHRGSVLGHLPRKAQPSQKRFETQLWQALRAFDPSRPVLVESESRKVGQCQIPGTLIEAMRSSPCVRVEASADVRALLLLDEYRHFVDDPGQLATRLEALVPTHGREPVDRWLALAREGTWPQFVIALLREHYDPAYDRSMRRNFPRLDQAPVVSLEAPDGAALDAAASDLAGEALEAAAALAGAAGEPVSGAVPRRS